MLNVFDIGIVLLLVMGVIVGFKRGVIKEAVSLVGIIAVFIFSFALKDILGNLLCTILPFFKFSGPIEGISVLNILMYQMIAFIIIFSILLTIYEIVMKISKFIQKLVNLTIILIIPSKILGGIISLIKTYIVLTAVFLVLMIPIGNSPLFRDSTLINFMLYKTPIISSYTSNFVNPVKEIYSLLKNIDDKNKNEINLESLDIMLKYDVVSKKTVNNLIKLHKLDDIKNIENILEKY